MAQVLDGKALSQKVKAEVKRQVESLQAQGKETQLAVILVGDDPASTIYVKHKHNDCRECGIISRDFRLSKDASQDELIELVKTLNEDEGVDGILVQLPLPSHINAEEVIKTIVPDKDVDGFHPYTQGLLSIGTPSFIPCTPKGILEFFDAYGLSIAGKHAVVVGRSNIVGKPVAQLLTLRDATVTLCHSKTENLSSITRQADILVCAVGVAKAFDAAYVKSGAVVIDVGMNRDDAGQLCGDVDYEDVKDISSFITPVPGGVGPMTRAELMRNTVQASQEHFNKQL